MGLEGQFPNSIKIRGHQWYLLQDIMVVRGTEGDSCLGSIQYPRLVQISIETHGAPDVIGTTWEIVFKAGSISHVAMLVI